MACRSAHRGPEVPLLAQDHQRRRQGNQDLRSHFGAADCVCVVLCIELYCVVLDWIVLCLCRCDHDKLRVGPLCTAAALLTWEILLAALLHAFVYCCLVPASMLSCCHLLIIAACSCSRSWSVAGRCLHGDGAARRRQRPLRRPGLRFASSHFISSSRVVVYHIVLLLVLCCQA